VHPKVVAVQFQVDEGPLTTIERVDVLGPAHIPEAKVSGVIRGKPGDRFSHEGIVPTKKAVSELGGTESVVVNYRTGSTASKVVVTIEVTEKAAIQWDMRQVVSWVALGLLTLAVVLAVALAVATVHIRRQEPERPRS
jgi:outer membrane protein assembly factor BamA